MNSVAKNIFAQVVVNTPLGVISAREENLPLAESLRERTFTYAIPNHLAEKTLAPHTSAGVSIGQLVWVPFGARRLQGVIIAFSDSSPVAETKDIDEIVDPRPLLDANHLDLARWIAREYLCSLNDAIQLMIPLGIEQTPVVYLSKNPSPYQGEGEGGVLTPKQLTLLELFSSKPELKLTDIPRNMRGAIDGLVRRGILLKQTIIPPPRAKPKHAKFVRLVSDALPDTLTRNPQADALEYLAQKKNILPSVTQVCDETHITKATLEAMAKKGWLQIASAQDLITLTKKYFDNPPALPQTQARALVQLRELGIPVAPKQIKANTAVLRLLEEKGYVERIRAEATIVSLLTPSELSQRARELRAENRYTQIVSYLKQEPASVWISALYAATNSDMQTLRKLEAVGVIALEEEEVTRDSLAGREFESTEPPQLTLEQSNTFEKIKSQLLKPNHQSPIAFLLHGVTGSGKTEIYLRALTEIISQGKQGIALVPEISLTPQTIRRFGARFKHIAVVHSRLSEGERYDTWRRCRDGQVDVVIGTRSALFAPLPNLGLIVLDEEHDASYKQAELPHYHARETAIELARRVGATVILGSATPNLESYYRAVRGEYTLLELPKRILGHTKTVTNHQLPTTPYLELPPVEIVDLRAELKAGNRSMFSRALQREMARALAANEQVILFLNRRGSATFILCRDCGYVFKCRRCDNPLTYHGFGNELQCHHCGRRDRVPTKCPNCGSARIKYFGMGTEKVEEEIQRLFPDARTLRWDVDVTRGKNSHEEILQKFISHQADVLIGTQMIAKGLDLPRVTLVGVISADTALNLPDFRASERTFQLLTQVAGRAGRSALGGKVIVQSYNPDHYAIVAASHHDYRAFYDQEISFRRESGYPPFNRLIRLVYAHASEPRARSESERLSRALGERIAQKGLPGIDLLGPAPAFFHRVRGQYRFQILVRGDAERLHALVDDIALPLGWRVDVDPASVL